MPIIETTEDLLRLLDENEEFLAAVRNKILTQELLALPGRFEEHTAETGRRLDNIESDVGTVKSDVETVKSDVETVKSDVVTVKSDVETVKSDVVTLKSDVVTLKSDVATLKGWGLEGTLPTRARSKLVGDLFLRIARVIRVADDSRGSEDFTGALWNSLDNGIISESEYTRVLRTDMILRAQRRSAEGIDFYIVVEASYTYGKEDLDRVLKSATTLRKVFPDTEIMAALYFVQIGNEDLRNVEAAGVKVIRED